MPDRYGSPDKPLKLKCTSIGSPAKDRHYWCLVTSDGAQYYFEIGGFHQAMLISVQSGEAASKLSSDR